MLIVTTLVAFLLQILILSGAASQSIGQQQQQQQQIQDASASGETKKKPNIIVILADDMGWNDVGFHGSNEIPTPNIDALAYNGVILNTHYTQALCTPSRAAFLTGKYPIHLGMQHLVILEPEPWGLQLNETILPQHLKRHGYKTHAIGKWHLGFFKKDYTPTYRGFDSHFGYWQGMQDYYEHTNHATYTSEFGYDMRRNMSVDWDARGKYSTTLFTDEAVKLINEHDVAKSPMFMYLAHLAPHSGNDEEPLQAPDEEIAKFSHIEDPERRIYAAMVSMLDESVGKVVTALRRKRMLENSIILFMSDNGAKSHGIHANHGSNYPLRGLKNGPWEGAMRCVAAIWSPLIKKPQRVSNQMIHISDWLPTIYSAVGLNRDELGVIDGKDMWKTISEDAKSPRTDFVYNIDDVWNYAAIREGDWKYVYRTSKMRTDLWYGASGNESYYKYTGSDVLTSSAAVAINALSTYKQISEASEGPMSKHTSTTELLTERTIDRLRTDATVRCATEFVLNHRHLPHTECDPLVSPCLFNVKEDPCERINLAVHRPLLLVSLEQSLMRIKKTVRAPINVPRDPNADPKYWNGTWTNWQDYDLWTHTALEEILTPMNILFLVLGTLSLVIVLGVLVVCIRLRQLRKQKTYNEVPLKSFVEGKQ